MSFELEYAKSNDVEPIQKLARTSQGELGFVMRTIIKSAILKKEALIVRGEGRVIAFCLFRFIKKGYIVIDDVYVDRAYRKQGIGRLFFTYLTRNCPVQLKVTQDNNANEFYKRIGGILVSIDKGKKRPLNIYRFPPQ
jgi:N-acetylglutamate synthase-like GNAT family acetyltransferase